MLRLVAFSLSVSVLGILGGCASRARTAASLPPPPSFAPQSSAFAEPLAWDQVGQPTFLDLQPGWRLRVTTPLTKSGGYELKAATQEASGNTVTISAGAELEGYETAFYAIEPAEGNGVRVEFRGAEVTRDGVTLKQQQTVRPLSPVPPQFGYVRLLYTARITSIQPDHDMAVIAADTPQSLEAFTRRVREQPDECRAGSHTFCAWIPRGMAVEAQQRTERAGSDTWAPVR